jgi:hypothetical protein
VYRTIADVPGPIDIVSLYVPAAIGIGLLEAIAARQPGEVWINPGAESPRARSPRPRPRAVADLRLLDCRARLSAARSARFPGFDTPPGRSYTRRAGSLPPAQPPTSTVDIRFHPQLILAVAGIRDHARASFVSADRPWPDIRDAPQGAAPPDRLPPPIEPPDTVVEIEPPDKVGGADPPPRRPQGDGHPEPDAGRQGPGRRQRVGLAQAGPDLPDPQGAGRAERLRLLGGRARGAVGRLRLPARPRVQLPGRPRRHLRVAVADPQVRPADRRHRSRARSGRRKKGSATSR